MNRHQPHSRRDRARVCRPLAEPLEERSLLTTLLALSDAKSLIRFDSATLATIGAPVPITGVPAGEEVRAIDVRPRNGALYALTTGQAGTQTVGRLYLLSLTSTGATAQRVSPTANFILNSDQIGIDFNPVSDRLRVVTGGSDLSIVVDPATGSAIQYDPSLTFAATYAPPPVQATPDVTAIAYANNVDGATSTALYGYEFDEDDLVTIGIATGVVTKVGDSGVIAGGGDSSLTGLDIEGTSTSAFAALQVTGTNALLSINLATGAAVNLGAIPMPAGTSVRDLAVAPVPRVQFELADYQFDENVGNATGRVRRTGDLTGPATVTFQTNTTGTATPGTDFTATTTILAFADGQEYATFSVSIADDTLAEPVETIGVALTGPSTGSTLGSQSTATLTIRANDPDTTAPTVDMVRAVVSGRRRNRHIESILVTFSERINPDRAQNVASYLIHLTGRFRRSPLTNFAIARADYNDSTRTATLIPTNFIRVDRASQLVIRGTAPDGIADLAGNFLAGGDVTRRLI